MKNTDFLNEDLERFAEYMGFEGVDSDLFYESYYNIRMGKTEDEYEIYWDSYSH